MKVSSKHVNKVLKAETATLYGKGSQKFRLEWITSTGGSLNRPHNVMVGKTDTLHISDNVSGIWGPVMRDQREKVDLDGQMINIDQLGFCFFPNSLNLAGLQDLLILQRITDQYYTGDGIGAGSVWTPDGAPSFTLNEWISYWLVFSDRRFRITGNDEGTITVDLTKGIPSGKQTLPTGSTTAEILGFIEWYPVRRDFGFIGGAMSPLNTQTIMQSIFVSRIPVVGR